MGIDLCMLRRTELSIEGLERSALSETSLCAAEPEMTATSLEEFPMLVSGRASSTIGSCWGRQNPRTRTSSPEAFPTLVGSQALVPPPCGEAKAVPQRSVAWRCHTASSVSKQSRVECLQQIKTIPPDHSGKPGTSSKSREPPRETPSRGIPDSWEDL